MDSGIDDCIIKIFKIANVEEGEEQTLWDGSELYSNLSNLVNRLSKLVKPEMLGPDFVDMVEENIGGPIGLTIYSNNPAGYPDEVVNLPYVRYMIDGGFKEFIIRENKENNLSGDPIDGGWVVEIKSISSELLVNAPYYNLTINKWYLTGSDSGSTMWTNPDVVLKVFQNGAVEEQDDGVLKSVFDMDINFCNISNSGTYEDNIVPVPVPEPGPAPEENPPSAPICFIRDTPVKTDQGNVKIQEINTDIHTINGKKILAITKTKLDGDLLVRVEKNAFAEDCPNHSVVMSGNHKILYNNELIMAKDLALNMPGKLNYMKYMGDTLYNVLMENYETMMVNNMVVETLHPENKIALLYRCLLKCSNKEKIETINKYIELTNV